MRNNVVSASGVFFVLTMFFAAALTGCSPVQSVISIGNEEIVAPPQNMLGVYRMYAESDEQIIVLERAGPLKLTATIYNALDDDTREEIEVSKQEKKELFAFLQSIGAKMTEEVTLLDENDTDHAFIGGMRYDIRLIKEGDRFIGELSYDAEITEQIKDSFEPFMVTGIYYYLVFAPAEENAWMTRLLSTDDFLENEFDEKSSTLLLNQTALRAALRRVTPGLDLSPNKSITPSKLRLAQK